MYLDQIVKFKDQFKCFFFFFILYLHLNNDDWFQTRKYNDKNVIETKDGKFLFIDLLLKNPNI